ncbi:MAG: hypothetical protein CMJ83_14455 [Planctomycetes bacterium]|nr:hypothetical protein [Planctomycetota bacterium]
MPHAIDLIATGSSERPVATTLVLPAGDGPCPLVVIAHGFKGFKDWGFFPDLSERCAAAGWAALRINFSHNGTGLGADSETFSRLDLFEQDRMSYRLLDLLAAVRAARDHEPRIDDRLALFGHSLGGAAVILAMKSLAASAVVTLASVDTVRFPKEHEALLRREGRLLIPNARTGQMMPVGIAALRDLEAHADEYDLDAAARLHGKPWLVIHGSADPTVPVRAAHRLSGLASATSELLVIDGADHVMDCKHPFAGPSAAYESMWAGVADFLAKSF